MKKQRGAIQVLIIIAVLVILTAIVSYFASNKGVNPLSSLTGSTGQSTSAQPSVPPVNSPKDLTAVSNDLDNTNIDGLNNDLNQINTDASGF